jgi:hypothetical protein
MDLWDQSTTTDDAGKPAAAAQLSSQPTGQNTPLPAAPPPAPQNKADYLESPAAPKKPAAPSAPQGQPGGAYAELAQTEAKRAAAVAGTGGAVDVSNAQYDDIQQALKHSDDPQGDSYRIATAMTYAKQTGLPLETILPNLQVFNRAILGQEYKEPASMWRDLQGAVENGNWFIKAGRIGQALAEDPQNPEYRQAAAEVNKGLEETAQYANRNILTQAAQMTPFLAQGLAVSVLGGGLVGEAANIANMSAINRGADFLRIQRDTQAALVKKGVDPEEAYQKATDVAGPISTTSGIIEGSLGELLGGFPALRGLMGKGAAPITSRIIDSFLQDGVTSRVGQKLALAGGLHYAGTALESGANMAAFELTQRLSDKTAAALSDSGIPAESATQIGKDVAGAFGNGILIGLLTGVPSLAKAGIVAARSGGQEAAVRVTEAKNLASLAKTYDQAGFEAAAEKLDLVSFKGM